MIIFFLRFVVFNFYETPQYLLSRGRDEAALEVLQQIAKVNKAAAIQFSIQDFQEIDRRVGNVDSSKVKKVETTKETFVRSSKQLLGQFKVAKYLFSNRRMTRLTIVIWVVFIAGEF